MNKTLFIIALLGSLLTMAKAQDAPNTRIPLIGEPGTDKNQVPAYLR